MQRELATLSHGTDLYLVFISPFRGGEPLHLCAFIFKTRLERWHREHRMDGISISIYCCEESLHIQRVWATYRARSARPHSWCTDSSATHPSQCFLLRVPP